MMVRWMCEVFLRDRKDRKWSDDLNSLMGIQNVADVVRWGRLRVRLRDMDLLGPEPDWAYSGMCGGT